MKLCGRKGRLNGWDRGGYVWFNAVWKTSGALLGSGRHGVRRVREGDHLSGPHTEATVSLVSFPQVRLGALCFAAPARDLRLHGE